MIALALSVRDYLSQFETTAAESITSKMRRKVLVGIMCFESRDYPLVKRLDQGSGVGQQEDHLNVRMRHLQVPGVARSIVDKQGNLECKVLFCQVPLHLRDKIVMEPVDENYCHHPHLPVGPPKHGQRVLVLALEGMWVLQHTRVPETSARVQRTIHEG